MSDPDLIDNDQMHRETDLVRADFERNHHLLRVVAGIVLGFAWIAIAAYAALLSAR